MCLEIATEIRNRRNEVRNEDANERTGRRRLAERNVYAFFPARVPDLLLQNQTARLRFLNEYGNWTVEHRNDVIFRNESRTALRERATGHQRFYKQAKKRLAQCTVGKTVGYEVWSILVFGSI